MKRLVLVVLVLGLSLVVTTVIVGLRQIGNSVEFMGWFGLPTSASEEEVFYATLELKFPKVLYRFFTIQDLTFKDESEKYVMEDAWVLIKGTRGVFRASSVDTEDNWHVVALSGYKPQRSDVDIQLKLQVNTNTEVDTGQEFAGPNELVIRYSFMGFSFEKILVWNPNEPFSLRGR